MSGSRTESIIEAFYRVLLLREPDPASSHKWCSDLDSGELGVQEILERFVRSEEFQRNFARFSRAFQDPAHRRFCNDHSEYGEVPLLLRRMVDAGTTDRFVVDVGARGRERSNSYDLLVHFGWQGLLIEANPHLIPTLKAEFDGLACQIVNVAISDYNGTAQFNLGANDDVSSLHAANAASWGAVRGNVEVPVRRLGGILASSAVPTGFDLLSLDIEGEDIKVLNDLIANTVYRPKWVILEASFDFSVASLEQIDLLPVVRECYRLTDRTRANLILERRI